MASNATLSAPSTLSPEAQRLADSKKRVASLPGIFSSFKDATLDRKVAARAVRIALNSTVSERAATASKWAAARKREDYEEADRLLTILKATPAEAINVDALHETALGLAPLQVAGASVEERVAYKLTVAALIKAGRQAKLAV